MYRESPWYRICGEEYIEKALSGHMKPTLRLFSFITTITQKTLQNETKFTTC